MHRGNGKPRVHARDHEHGGADTTLIHYEDVGDPGTGGTGIQFDTYPQAGEWLYIETDGPGDAPGGGGVEIYDASGNGIGLTAGSSGQLQLLTSGGGTIVLQSTGQIVLDASSNDIILQTTGHILLDSLPTSAPGVSGALWNDGGTVKIT